MVKSNYLPISAAVLLFLFSFFTNSVKEVNGRINTAVLDEDDYDSERESKGAKFTDTVCLNLLAARADFVDDQLEFIRHLLLSESVDSEGSLEYFNAISLYLRNSSITEQKKAESSCVRKKFNYQKRFLSLKGYGKQRDLHCILVFFGYDPNPGLECTGKNGTFEMSIAAVWTNVESAVLFVGCAETKGDETGETFWFLSRLASAPSSSIEKSDRIQIKKVLTKLNFNIEKDWVKVEDKNCKEEKTGRSMNLLCLKNMISLTIFSISREFIEQLLENEVLIPEGSISYYDTLSRLLINKPWDKADWNQACLKRNFDIRNRKLTISGFGQKVVLDCQYENFGSFFSIFRPPKVLCESRDKKFQMSLAIVLTDGTTSAMFIECLPNGDTVYTFSALNGLIRSRSQYNEIFNSFGNNNAFSKQQTYKLSYATCGGHTEVTTTTMRPAVKPGPPPPGCIVGIEGQRKNRDAILDVLYLAYTPMAHIDHYYYLSDTARSGSVPTWTSTDQIPKNLCPSVVWNINGGVLLYGQNSTRQRFYCDTRDPDLFRCWNKKVNPNPSQDFYIGMEYFGDCVLSIRCYYNPGRRIWAVHCYEPVIKPELKKIILASIEAHKLEYEKPKTITYIFKPANCGAIKIRKPYARKLTLETEFQY